MLPVEGRVACVNPYADTFEEKGQIGPKKPKNGAKPPRLSRSRLFLRGRRDFLVGPIIAAREIEIGHKQNQGSVG